MNIGKKTTNKLVTVKAAKYLRGENIKCQFATRAAF
jgi:hypothetical protein